MTEQLLRPPEVPVNPVDGSRRPSNPFLAVPRVHRRVLAEDRQHNRGKRLAINRGPTPNQFRQRQEMTAVKYAFTGDPLRRGPA